MVVRVQHIEGKEEAWKAINSSDQKRGGRVDDEGRFRKRERKEEERAFFSMMSSHLSSFLSVEPTIYSLFRVHLDYVTQPDVIISVIPYTTLPWVYLYGTVHITKYVKPVHQNNKTIYNTVCT